MKAAATAGIFCALLAGYSFLITGLMGRAFSLDPIVPFSMIAGVLTPMVMVVSGMLARWSSPGLPETTAMTSLASGALTAVLGAILCSLMVTISPGNILPYLPGFDATALPGLAVLLGAYLTFSMIGGAIYESIFRVSKS